MNLSVSISRCASNSSLSCRSWRSRMKAAKTREVKDRSRESTGLTPPFELQHAYHQAGNPLPVLFLPRELLPPRPCDGIEFCLPVVFRGAPFGRDPSLLSQPHQGCVDGAFV